MPATLGAYSHRPLRRNHLDGIVDSLEALNLPRDAAACIATARARLAHLAAVERSARDLPRGINDNIDTAAARLGRGEVTPDVAVAAVAEQATLAARVEQTTAVLTRAARIAHDRTVAALTDAAPVVLAALDDDAQTQGRTIAEQLDKLGDVTDDRGAIRAQRTHRDAWAKAVAAADRLDNVQAAADALRRYKLLPDAPGQFESNYGPRLYDLSDPTDTHYREPWKLRDVDEHGEPSEYVRLSTIAEAGPREPSWTDRINDDPRTAAGWREHESSHYRFSAIGAGA